MRCNNCGWNNSKGLVRCEKCNYPLDGSLNLRDGSDLDSSSDADDGSKTVKGQAPNTAAWDRENKSTSKPNVKEGAEILQNFQTTGDTEIKAKTSQKSSEAGEELSTINPFTKAKKESSMPASIKGVLSICRVDTETNEIVETKKIDIGNQKVVLNRQSVNPENRTISSKGHAELIWVEDKIFLKNLNSAKTTFIRVDKLTEVKKGTCILLGNELIRID